MERFLGWLTPEERVRRLSPSTAAVLDVVRKNWPVNPLDVAKALNDLGDPKTLSAKYLYHFRKLYKLKLIRMKKIGNTYIAWPTEIEKLRVIREMLGGV
jgi:hypothetical protein